MDSIKRAAAEIYWQIQEEITNCTLMEYMYHDVRLESNSHLPKWVGRRIISKKVVNGKRFKSKDILLAQNLFRAIQFVRRAASTPEYNITEADIKHIHAMLSENLGISKPGEYRSDNTNIDVTKWYDIPKEMRELVNFMNSRDYRKLRPVERSACTHYRVVRIQPFPNFNNAVASLIMNFILLKNGYPLTIIEFENKQEYLDCLARDSIHFIQFVTKVVLNASQSYLNRTQERLDLNLPSIKLGHRPNSVDGLL